MVQHRSPLTHQQSEIELLKAQKKREKEFLEEQDRKDEWERVLTGKKREQEISIAELKGIGPLGDFWQSYLGKSFTHWFNDDTIPFQAAVQDRPRTPVCQKS